MVGKSVLFIFSIVAQISFTSEAKQVREIKVQDLNQTLKRAGKIKDSIIKTEVVNSKDIEKKQATNLSEAIKDEVGVESREGCSICGMRRVRINGMRGEHTTVLMDGVPLNSTVSSFYGFDALGTSGIERVEISRGAGAALIAPEAIGGVINVVRKKAIENSSNINTAIGDYDYKLLSGTITRVSEDGRSGTTLSGQFSEQGQMDFDDNGVNESPNVTSYLTTLKHSRDLNANNNITVDITSLQSDTFGGPMDSSIYGPTVNTDNGPTFANNDVRNQYIGTPDQITEIVKIQRNEATVTYTRMLSDTENFVFKQSYALQVQDSWYEGSDYYHTNQTLFSDLQYNNQINLEHFFTLGIDNKDETLKSKSHEFFNVLGRERDNYDYNSLGLYVRDIWTPKSNIELSTALRINQITTDWTDQGSGEEIDETLLAPRVHLKYGHTEKLVSRLGLGIGYRSPLTFFESEHGLLDDGFAVNITELEKSKSLTYSLAYDSDRFLFSGGLSKTLVDNLAYVDDSQVTPVLRNYTNELDVMNFDLTFGYQLNRALSVGLTLEHFDYDDEYKSLMVVAAIEERIKFDIEYESDTFMLNFLATWVGSRGLTKYGYSDRFNIHDGATGSARKITTAPAYVVFDLKATLNLTKDLKFYGGVKNLLDETQEESPLFFDESGDFDVTHIYGPLRGRQIYAGLQSSF